MYWARSGPRAQRPQKRPSAPVTKNRLNWIRLFADTGFHEKKQKLIQSDRTKGSRDHGYILPIAIGILHSIVSIIASASSVEIWNTWEDSRKIHIILMWKLDETGKLSKTDVIQTKHYVTIFSLKSSTGRWLRAIAKYLYVWSKLNYANCNKALSSSITVYNVKFKEIIIIVTTTIKTFWQFP